MTETVLNRIRVEGEGQVTKVDLAIMRTSGDVFLSAQGKAAQELTASAGKQSYGPDVGSPTVRRPSAADAQSLASKARTAT